MDLVDKVWGHIPTKLQIDPTDNHGVRPLEHNPSTRLMPLGHKVSVYGIKRIISFGDQTFNYKKSFKKFQLEKLEEKKDKDKIFSPWVLSTCIILQWIKNFNIVFSSTFHRTHWVFFSNIREKEIEENIYKN